MSIQAKIEILSGKLLVAQRKLVVAQCANRDELKAQPTRVTYKVRESPRNSVIRLLNLKAGVKFRANLNYFTSKEKDAMIVSSSHFFGSENASLFLAFSIQGPGFSAITSISPLSSVIP